jgi:hypothetical protein
MLVLHAAACVAVGIAPYAAMYAAMVVIGVTAGLASALLSGAFQRIVAPEYLGRAGSIQSLRDDALMPLAMVGFDALAAGTSIALACAVRGIGFAVLVTWSASRPSLSAA